MKYRTLYPIFVLSLVSFGCGSSSGNGQPPGTEVFYSLNIEDTTGGRVTTTPASADRRYAKDTLVLLQIVPDEGYSFSGWSGDSKTDIIFDDQGYQIIMNGDKSIQAAFQKAAAGTKYTLTISYNGAGTTVPPAGSYSYDAGTTVSLAAQPESGYTFSGWSGDSSSDVLNNTIVMDSDKTLVAGFSLIPANTKYTLTIQSTGEGTTSPGVGSHDYESGTVVSLSAQPGSDYAFSGWSGDNGPEVSNNSITMNSNKTIIANFTLIPKCVLTISISGSGFINLVSGTPYTCGATTPAIVATPSNGWLLQSISGVNTDNTVTMNSSQTVNIVFAPILADIEMVLVPYLPADSIQVEPDHSYYIGKCEIKAHEWNAIYNWAINKSANKYVFANAGTAPADSYPISGVAFQDAVVWCNALTEYSNTFKSTNYGFVFKNGDGTIVRDATNLNLANMIVGGNEATGYRLPSDYEWEFAARYEGTTPRSTSSVGVFNSGSPSNILYYITLGSWLSGATGGDYKVDTSTGWYRLNSSGTVHECGGLPGNALGLFDMSGNVHEYTNEYYLTTNVVVAKGGAYDSPASYLQIEGDQGSSLNLTNTLGRGLRVVHY